MHELTDRRADGGDDFVVGDELLVKARFELVEVLGQFLVGSEKRTQLHERAHDVYGHLYGALAAEYIGGLFGVETEQKSSWNRAALRLTASFRGLVETP